VKILATCHKLLLFFYRPLVRNKIKSIKAFNIIRIGQMVPIIHKIKMFRQCFLNGIYAFSVMNKMFDRYSELDTELEALGSGKDGRIAEYMTLNLTGFIKQDLRHE
jgi:hypothetical protein